MKTKLIIILIFINITLSSSIFGKEIIKSCSVNSANVNFPNDGSKPYGPLVEFSLRITNSLNTQLEIEETDDFQKCLDKMSKGDIDFLPNLVIKDDREQIISAETAYQITSMLEGVVKRGTGKNLRSLNLNLAGKTGTTNKNMDAWFMGFTSKLVIGVYVGFDDPESLGKYETGARAALPIFKKFVKKVVTKSDARPFKIPKTIKLVAVDLETGLPPNSNTKKIIYESFKQEDNFLNNLENLENRNKLSINNEKILTFY